MNEMSDVTSGFKITTWGASQDFYKKIISPTPSILLENFGRRDGSPQPKHQIYLHNILLKSSHNHPQDWSLSSLVKINVELK